MPDRGDMPQFDPENMPDQGQRPRRPGGGQAPAFLGGQAPSAAQPDNMPVEQSGDAKLPFLIQFDGFADGRSYQGCSRLAIRTYGISSDADRRAIRGA